MLTKKKIIFICTGNACRSQIAHGLLENIAGDKFEVFSAGSHPSRVHTMSIKIMEEIGIDISHHTSDFIDDYLKTGIEIVITLCDNANETCPLFPGDIKKIHWSINDPIKALDYNKHQIESFRKTREDIKSRIIKFIESYK